MIDRLLTILAFAEYIAASKRTAKRIIGSGEMPSYKVRGRVMVKLSDVELWLEENRIERTVADQPSNLKILVSRAVKRARERGAS
jgi:excisionase family DNA binding protein